MPTLCVCCWPVFAVAFYGVLPGPAVLLLLWLLLVSMKFWERWLAPGGACLREGPLWESERGFPEVGRDMFCCISWVFGEAERSLPLFIATCFDY